MGIAVHKQYSLLDTIFHYTCHFGTPGTYLETSRENGLSAAGFAGWRIVDFWDLSIDIFLEVQHQNIVKYRI